MGGDSQTYCEFMIHFVDINLPNRKSQKTHMVKKKEKKRKRKNYPKSKLRSHFWHQQPSLVIRSSHRSDALPLCAKGSRGSTEILGADWFVFLLSASDTSCFENFFFLHFWEKNILNKCSKSYLVLKLSKFLSSFQICPFQAYLLISLL